MKILKLTGLAWHPEFSRNETFRLVGVNLWTDGFIETKDDSSGFRRIHVHNKAFENIMFSDIEFYFEHFIFCSIELPCPLSQGNLILY